MMRTILIPVLMSLLLSTTVLAGKKKKPAKDTPPSEWKGPYTSIIIPSSITRYMGTFRKDLMDYFELLDEQAESGGGRRGRSVKDEITDYKEDHEKFFERFERTVKQETEELTSDAEKLDQELAKLAELEEEHFEDEAKMAEITKKTDEIRKKLNEIDLLRAEYNLFTNACWPETMRSKDNPLSSNSPFATVGRSLELSGTTIGPTPKEYSLSEDPAKLKIVVFTSLEHKPSLQILGGCKSLMSVSRDFPVSLVHVNVDYNPESVKAAYAGKSEKFVTVADADKRLASTFKVKFLPHIALLGEKGEVICVYMAATSSDLSHLRSAIRDLKRGKKVYSIGSTYAPDDEK